MIAEREINLGQRDNRTTTYIIPDYLLATSFMHPKKIEIKVSNNCYGNVSLIYRVRPWHLDRYARFRQSSYMQQE